MNRKLHVMSTLPRFVSLLVLGVWLSGCATPGSSVPAPGRGTPEAAYTVLSDTDAGVQKRIAAITTLQAAVGSGATPAETARAALKRAAWSWHQGTPSQVRIAAIDALLADEANLDDTHNMLRLMTPTEQQREVLEHVCQVATARAWGDMTPAIVRSWSRPVPGWEDLSRPEAQALLALWPGQDHDATLFSVFAGSDGADDKARSAAWAMLTRLDASGERTRALVRQAGSRLDASTDPIAGAIARAWREMQIVPVTPEQLAWTQRLLEPQHDAHRQAIIAATALLPPERRERLELRHGPLMVWAHAQDATLIDAPLEALVEHALLSLQGSRSYGPGARARAQDLARADWSEVLTALAAVQATRDPDLGRALFQQADADQLDTSTEHGGVIEAASDGGWQAIAFPPRPTERFGDRQFVASEDMIRRGDTALFHYHFHVQSHANRNYAVPSGGDYDTARRLGRASLVFTFVDRDHMNVDLYFPSGVLIDLGAIERPQ